MRPRSWLASGDKRLAATLERRAARAAFATWEQRGLGANVLQCASDETCVLPAAVQLVLDEQQEALRRAKSLPASSLSGYCAQTPCIKHDYHTSARSCNRADFGCWLAREHGIKDLADCVERCRACRNCNYVSFSRSSAHNDCSWFRACPKLSLGGDLRGYFTSLVHRTYQVRLAGGELASVSNDPDGKLARALVASYNGSHLNRSSAKALRYHYRTASRRNTNG